VVGVTIGEPNKLEVNDLRRVVDVCFPLYTKEIVGPRSVAVRGSGVFSGLHNIRTLPAGIFGKLGNNCPGLIFAFDICLLHIAFKVVAFPAMRSK